MVTHDVTVERVTTLLDVLAIALVVAGAVGGLWEWLGWFALVVGGVLLFADSQLAARVGT